MFGMTYSSVKFHAHIQIMHFVQPKQVFFFPLKIVQGMKLPLMYRCPLHLAVNFYMLKTYTPRSPIYHGVVLFCHVHVL